MRHRWYSRDKFDLTRSIEESIQPPSGWMIEVQDGQLSYRKEQLGNNGKISFVGETDAPQENTEVSQSPVEIALFA